MGLQELGMAAAPAAARVVLGALTVNVSVMTHLLHLLLLLRTRGCSNSDVIFLFLPLWLGSCLRSTCFILFLKVGQEK